MPVVFNSPGKWSSVFVDLFKEFLLYIQYYNNYSLLIVSHKIGVISSLRRIGYRESTTKKFSVDLCGLRELVVIVTE